MALHTLHESAQHSMNNAAANTLGWVACLELHYGVRRARTRLLAKRQQGPLTLQRPFYPEGNTCHSYILHPPGGVVGGDTLQIKIDTEAGAHCLLTNPGASKFYRSHALQQATVSQHMNVREQSIVEWLPQQNIFFAGANVRLDTSINIAAGGHYLGWEINCLGRPANGETFDSGSVRCATQVSIGGELRLAEQLNVRSQQALSATCGLRGLPVQASLIAAPCTTEQIDVLERILQASPGREYPYPIGMTLVDEVLVVRALGEQTEALHQVFALLWAGLRLQWLHKPACTPRIWST